MPRQRITTDQVWQLVADATHSPLSREQVIEQVLLALRRQQYLTYREQRGRQTAYDEVARQDVEALARAIQGLARGEGSRMKHQLEHGDDGRAHCTICLWSWASRANSIKTYCPGVPRYAGYERMPAHLKTFTMLRKAGLKTEAQPVGCIYIQS